MAITRLWLNLPYKRNDEDVAGICAMSFGLLKQCPLTIHIAPCLRVPISEGVPPNSG